MKLNGEIYDEENLFKWMASIHICIKLSPAPVTIMQIAWDLFTTFHLWMALASAAATAAVFKAHTSIWKMKMPSNKTVMLQTQSNKINQDQRSA